MIILFRITALRRPYWWLVILIAGALPAGAATNLKDRLETWESQHRKTIEQAEEKGAGGDMAGSVRMLVQLADKDGGGIAAFVVGNMLFNLAPDASYQLHARAFKALTDEPAVTLEMAMEQHRRGEYALAIPHYRFALKDEEARRYAALLADCLVRTGQLKEAVLAWEQARHGQNHSGIEEAIQEIYLPLPPLNKRNDLLAGSKAGGPDNLEELLVYDVGEGSDLSDDDALLAKDLKFAASLLGKNSPRYQQLAVYAHFSDPDQDTPDNIRRALTAAKLVVGPGAGLPESSLLARALVEKAVNHQVASAGEMWQAHAGALRERVKKHDRNALHLLCWLAAEDKDLKELEPLDRLGWNEWHEVEFGRSYIADLMTAKKLSGPNDPELLAILTVQPEESYLNQVRLELAGTAGVTEEMLVAAIKAEFRGFSTTDSYRLKNLFGLLRGKLGMPEEREVVATNEAAASTNEPKAAVEWEAGPNGKRPGEQVAPGKPPPK